MLPYLPPDVDAEPHDLAIIGGGPAGLAALSLARDCGLRSVLIDESRSLGGRIFNGLEARRTGAESLAPVYGMHADWAAGAAREAREDGTVLSGHTVLDIARDNGATLRIDVAAGQRLVSVLARRLLIATGAKERAFAFPGWTLNGVMTAGGVQTLLKASDVVPDGPTVLVGSGPLLLLVARQLARAGTPIMALLDTTPLANVRAAAPLLLPALFAGSAALTGLGLLRDLARMRIPIHRGASQIVAMGDDAVRSVRFREGGAVREIACELLVTHLGVVADTQVSRLAGCRHRWEPAWPGWAPVVDAHGNSSEDGIMIAGDAAGIEGVEVARHAGRMAAAEAARSLGVLSATDRDRLVGRDAERRRSLRRERAFIDRLFQPPPTLRVPSDETTIVCRCEEITLGTLRARAHRGVRDVDHLKALTRCGMGACQGRVCGDIAAQVLAQATGRPVDASGPGRVRAPLKPVPLAQVAARARIDSPPADAGFVYSEER